MTFLSLSPLRKDSTVPLFSQGWINAFAAPAQRSLFISEGMRLKGLLSPGDGSACIGPQGANVRKKARPGECRGGRKIRPLKCFSQTFLLPLPPPPRPQKGSLFLTSAHSDEAVFFRP